MLVVNMFLTLRGKLIASLTASTNYYSEFYTLYTFDK